MLRIHVPNRGVGKTPGTFMMQQTLSPSNFLDVPSPYSGSSRSSPGASPSPRKRSRTLLSETSVGERDDIYNKRRCSDGGAIIADSPPLLACPYSKYDSHRYSTSNIDEPHYRGCSGSFLRDIPRLKQHLYRVHAQPDHYCSCCFESFSEEAALHNHIRLRSCSNQPCPFPEMMTFNQKQSIKKRFPKKDPVECWYMIYQSLFPDSSLPENPFAEFLHRKAIDIPKDVQDLILENLPDQLAQQLAFQLQRQPCLTEDYNKTAVNLASSIKSILQSILNQPPKRPTHTQYEETSLQQKFDSHGDPQILSDYDMLGTNSLPLLDTSSAPMAMDSLQSSFFPYSPSLNLISSPVEMTKTETYLPNETDQLEVFVPHTLMQGSHIQPSNSNGNYHIGTQHEAFVFYSATNLSSDYT